MTRTYFVSIMHTSSYASEYVVCIWFTHGYTKKGGRLFTPLASRRGGVEMINVLGIPCTPHTQYVLPTSVSRRVVVDYAYWVLYVLYQKYHQVYRVYCTHQAYIRYCYKDSPGLCNRPVFYPYTAQ